jgi:hypothetical protein
MIHEPFAIELCPKRAVRRMCADAFGVEEHRLLDRSRKREITIPRHATYYVLKKRFPDMSYPRIGRLMGGKDHTTIIHGVRSVENHIARDAALRGLIESLLNWPLPSLAQHDAHVRLWRAYSSHMARCFGVNERTAPEFIERMKTRARLEAGEINPDDPECEFAALVDPAKVWCAQCDQAIHRAAAARCERAFCVLARDEQHEGTAA